MAKTRSLDHELGAQDAAKTMAPGDMCLLFMPRALFEKLSQIAAQRGMTLAQLMATALDTYLTADVEVAPGNAIDENVASFHFTPPDPAGGPQARVVPGTARAGFKGFR
jgi:hypothetical protein